MKHEKDKNENGPLVSVLLPTFNRPAYLAEALGSVAGQNYKNLQIIVVNDGGQDVSDIVNHFNDRRIIFINRKENRGKPFSLNEAILRAEGKYIAYLDDDDVHYPDHIRILVDALEGDTDCGVAYSDLYKNYCRISPDGAREALSKVVEVSRDFDRFLMLYYNHVLHVSMMHRRDLLEKTGPYNESLNILIDWDIARRLVFFSDFIHIHRITGEYFLCENKDDRISVSRRKDEKEYARNAFTIRTTRPAKPWSKLADLSIIFVAGRLDEQAGQTIGLIWRWTFYPYKLYLPLAGFDFRRFNTDMPNVVKVAVDAASTAEQQIDKILAECDGDYVAIVGCGFPIRDMWVEDSLYALLNSQNDKEAFELEGSTPDCRAFVVKKEHLRLARNKFPDMPVDKGLEAAGINIRRIKPEEIPFQFDTLLEKALREKQNGNWRRAAEIYEYIGNHYQNQIWMKSLAADALHRAGNLKKAALFASELNQQYPTVDTLLLEAKIKRKNGDFMPAVDMLKNAKNILESKDMSCANAIDCEPIKLN